jgi:hypothetical protein
MHFYNNPLPLIPNLDTRTHARRFVPRHHDLPPPRPDTVAARIPLVPP